MPLQVSLTEAAHAFQSHAVGENRSQREVGVGGPQMPLNEALGSGFHPGGIILTNLRVHS